MALRKNSDLLGPWWSDGSPGKPKSTPWTPAAACDALLADLRRTGTNPPAEATPSAADARPEAFYRATRTSGMSSSAGWEAIRVRDRTQEEV